MYRISIEILIEISIRISIEILSPGSVGSLGQGVAMGTGAQKIDPCMRIAMSRSFSTIVAAELLGANTGLGSLISTSREYSRMDTIAVGIVALGVMGFLVDHLFRRLSGWLAGEYGGPETGK